MSHRKLILSIFALTGALIFTACGGDTDPESLGTSVKKKTVFDGNDNLLLQELFYYDASAGEPSRIEYSKPNSSGNLVIVKMEEFEHSTSSQKHLVVEFDERTLAETKRVLTTESLDRVAGELVVTEKVVETEKGRATDTERTTFRFTEVGGDAKLSRRELTKNAVPVESEEWDYDRKGRPESNRLFDGDANLKRDATYDWSAGSLEELVYNDAGKLVEEVTGDVTFKFDRVIRLSETRVGKVIQTETSCSVKSRKIACTEVQTDKLSGEKTGQDETEVAIENNNETDDRILAEVHERYAESDRVLLVSDDWQYRADKQLQLQIHQIDTASEAALVQYQREFAELYDYRLSREYNESDLPVREHKDTEDPKRERVIKYEY